MKPLRPFVVIGAVACLLLGSFSALIVGGRSQAAVGFGQTLIIAGAILLAGGVIASAIAGQHK